MGKKEYRMKAILPIKINYSPINKLALINFEKKPDKLYKGFELQYIDGKTYGKGYRAIAYRNDFATGARNMNYMKGYPWII